MSWHINWIKITVTIIAICSILFFALLPIILKIASLEFASEHYRSNFESARWLALPVGIMLTLFGTIRNKDSRNRAEIKILVTFLVATLSFIIVFVGSVFNMCGWADEATLFVKVNNPADKIILRSYGCGTWDSGSPLYQVTEVKKWNTFFSSAKSIDTLQLNKQDWLRHPRE